MRFLFAVLCMFVAASAAQAAVVVEEQVLQKGLFANSKCPPGASDPAYDECQCDADIRYPQLNGLKDNQAQKAINDSFKRDAEQAMCAGEAVKTSPKTDNKKEPEKSPSSASHHYEVTFQSPTMLGIKLTDWAYTGGAHGNGSVSGVIIDLEKGNVLSINNIFAEKDMPAVNQVIYDTLAAKPEEEVFRDQIESRKGAFIVDSECQGCTLMLMPDGVHVVFQTYEVAPYAAGNAEVSIPTKYVTYPPILTALTDSKAPEKK